jgi:hypothetical protein
VEHDPGLVAHDPGIRGDKPFPKIGIHPRFREGMLFGIMLRRPNCPGSQGEFNHPAGARALQMVER